MLELWEEVLPGGVGAFDEFYFLLAGPVFDGLFASYGAANVLEVFKVYEAVDGVFGGVGSRDVFAMGCGAASEVVGDADVEITRTTGEDVDPEMEFAGRHGEW